MGFVTFLVFSAIQAAGDLIDVFGGFSLAAAFDPLSQNMNSVHGKLLSMLGMMLLFASDVHLLVIGGLLPVVRDDAGRRRPRQPSSVDRGGHGRLLDVLRWPPCRSRCR